MKKSYRKQIDVAYRDIDTAGHVSSTVYYNYMQNAYVFVMHKLMSLPWDEKIPQIMVKTSCEYIAPAKFGDQLNIDLLITRFGTKSFEIEYVISRSGSSEQTIAKGASTHVMFDYKSGKTLPVSDEFKRLVTDFQGDV
jgi:acyl-CoA thioester hydrolase